MSQIATASRKVYPQKDGRAQVVETFVLSTGEKFDVSILAEADLDLAAHQAAAGAQLLLDLAQAEIDRNVADIVANGSGANPRLVFSILADNAAAVRAAYLAAARTDAVMIGDYLSTLPALVLASAFGITQAAATALKTGRLAAAATLAAQIRASAGQ